MKRTIIKYKFNIDEKFFIDSNLIKHNNELVKTLKSRKISINDFNNSIHLEVNDEPEINKLVIFISSEYFDNVLSEMYFYVTPTNELLIDNQLAVKLYPKIFYKKELVHVNKIETQQLFRRLSLSNIMFKELFRLFPNAHYILRCNPFDNISKEVISKLYINQGFKYYPNIFKGHDDNLMFKK
jgi:hypothetical protein